MGAGQEILMTVKDELLRVESKLFNPHRMLIMKYLVETGGTTFPKLKKYLNDISDGNMASHIRALINVKMVGVAKRNKKPFTVYYTTQEGDIEYSKLRDVLYRYAKGEK